MPGLRTPLRINVSGRPVLEDAFVSHEQALQEKQEEGYDGFDAGIGEVLDEEAMRQVEVAMA